MNDSYVEALKTISMECTYGHKAEAYMGINIPGGDMIETLCIELTQDEVNLILSRAMADVVKDKANAKE